jgi:hypothetical protein
MNSADSGVSEEGIETKHNEIVYFLTKPNLEEDNLDRERLLQVIRGQHRQLSEIDEGLSVQSSTEKSDLMDA